MPARAAKARCTCACGAARVSAGDADTYAPLTLIARKSEKAHESVKLVGETSSRRSNAIRKPIHVREYGYHRRTRPVSAHNSMHAGVPDLRMLAQVEKWMAMIREISREQQSQPAFQR